MAVGIHNDDFGDYYFAKGDPEIILNMCTNYLTDNLNMKLECNFRLFVISEAEKINRYGNTSIAIAYSNSPIGEKPLSMTFLCLVELENKLQEGASEEIGKLANRGIRSIVLTGDREETAASISVKCGITKSPKVYLSGKMIKGMALADVARQAEYCSVFARLLPSHKGVIIRLLQQRNHAIAMIGDGTNDAIALKVADLPISFRAISSPIARIHAKILINRLGDLLLIFESGNRIGRRSKLIKFTRTIVLLSILILLYEQLA